MSSLIAVMFLTMIVFGPFAGNLVDQAKKVPLIYSMDYIRGVIVLLTALVIRFSTNTVFIVIVLYIMAVVTSVCTVIFNPASSSILPLIVKKEELMKANSFMSLTGSVTSIIGILFGGILYGIFGIIGILIIDGTSYILSGVSEMFIRAQESVTKHEPEAEGSGSESGFAKQVTIFKEGISYLLEKRGILYIGFFAMCMNFSMSPMFQIYQPYLIQESLKKNILHLTMLSIIASSGMLVGAITMSMITSRLKSKSIASLLIRISMLLVFFSMMITFLIFGVLRFDLSYPIFIAFYGVATFAIGITIAAINIPIETYIQKNTSPEMMGRVNSVVNTLSFLSMPLGYVLCGILIELISLEYAYVFNVAVLLIVSIMLLYKRNQINVDDQI